jgi:UDP-N-acetylglucosamine 3-dehydrogenase
VLKVGVIGVGQMGQHHARNYNEIPNVELVGIADTNRDRLEEMVDRFNVNAYVDYRDMLSEGLDAVSVVVPTSMHKDVALDVIESETHLLVEKPLADSVENARVIYDAVKNTPLKLAVGYIERFNPAVSKLKELIDDRIFGDLLLVSARRVGPFMTRIMDVGIVADSASHDIDVIRYLIGAEPKHSFSLWRGLKNRRGDHALIVFDFGNTLASVEVNWFSPTKIRNLIITGTDATAQLDYIKQSIVINTSEGEQVPKIERSEPLRVELEHFIDCIIHDKEPLVNIEEGLRTLEIATEAEKKHDTSC